MFAVTGYVALFFSSLGLFFSFKYALRGEYDKAHNAELIAVLWLIASILCLK